MEKTEGNVLSAGLETTSWEGGNVRLRLDRLTNPGMVLVTLNGVGGAESARVDLRELIRSLAFIFHDEYKVTIEDSPNGG